MALQQGVAPDRSAWRVPPPDFTGEDAPPIGWDERTPIGPDSRATVVPRLRGTGFALLLCRTDVSEWTVATLAAHLGLGEPFLPPLYRDGPVRPAAISAITAQPSPTAHPSFGLTQGQDLHTDGTLQRIGEVRTTVLACRRPAFEGGETTLFNATGAFAALSASDPAAAAALSETDCLCRRATVNGSNASHTAPAFEVLDGMLATRYSVGDTDSWVMPPGADEIPLRRGIAFLAWAQTSRTFARQMRLPENSALIFDNSRISHGRKPFHDRPDRPRLLFRGLYTQSPLDPPVVP